MLNSINNDLEFDDEMNDRDSGIFDCDSEGEDEPEVKSELPHPLAFNFNYDLSSDSTFHPVSTPSSKMPQCFSLSNTMSPLLKIIKDNSPVPSSRPSDFDKSSVSSPISSTRSTVSDSSRPLSALSLALKSASSPVKAPLENLLSDDLDHSYHSSYELKQDLHENFTDYPTCSATEEIPLPVQSEISEQGKRNSLNVIHHQEPRAVNPYEDDLDFYNSYHSDVEFPNLKKDSKASGCNMPEIEHVSGEYWEFDLSYNSYELDLTEQQIVSLFENNSNSKKESDIKKEPASKNNRDNNSFFKCQNPGEATQSIDEPEKSLDNYPGFPGWDLGSF